MTTRENDITESLTGDRMSILNEIAARTKEELQGGTPQENAEITKAILEGKETGAKRHAVCLNAGAALYIAGKAASIEAGVKMAEQLIDSGAALKKLEEFIQKSNQE